MPKTKIQEWDTTAANNTDINSINIDEGCDASNLNNSQRETMAQIATALSGSDDSIITGTAGGAGNFAAFNADGDLVAATGTATVESLAGLSLAADKGLYSTAANTLALFDLTSAGRALLDDADASTQRTTLGLGNIATTDLIDEDDMSSDTAAQAPTQQSVKAYVDTEIAGVASGDPNGVTGNAWTDVSGSRAYNTSYQNTSGEPLHVMVSATIGGSGEVGYVAIGPTTGPTGIVRFVGSADDVGSMHFVVPESHYYRITGTATVTILDWYELQ